MRLIAVFFLFTSCSSFAQTWQTIPNEHYNVSTYTGANVVSYNFSQFEINPLDGTMWFISNFSGSDFNLKRINTDGSMTLFTPSNMPYMDVNNRYFYGIEFSSNKVYALHRFDGVYSYDGTNWLSEAIFDKGTTVCSDGDTLYFGRENEDFFRLTETGSTYNYSNCRRMAVRNGNAWRSSSFDNFIQKLNPTFDGSTTYNPDTCNLLDWSNSDFKFARTSDTLYVAGDQGFSLAYGDFFEDTITMNTAPSMPYPSIIEFEFDSQDNIWAVFGDGGTQGFFPMYIGYYDRSVQDWTMIYDQSSCPVDFTEQLDIEIDLNDNLWVCDRNDLHVLKINTTPGWLSLVEKEIDQFSVFPNPSNGNITIHTEVNVSDMEILDASGRLIKKIPFQTEFQIEEEGTYIIRLLESGTIVGTRKVVVK